MKFCFPSDLILGCRSPANKYLLIGRKRTNVKSARYSLDCFVNYTISRQISRLNMCMLWPTVFLFLFCSASYLWKCLSRNKGETLWISCTFCSASTFINCMLILFHLSPPFHLFLSEYFNAKSKHGFICEYLSFYLWTGEDFRTTTILLSHPTKLTIPYYHLTFSLSQNSHFTVSLFQFRSKSGRPTRCIWLGFFQYF